MLKITIMSKPNRTIIGAVFLGVFIIAGIFNVSYGQAKVDKLDQLIPAVGESERSSCNF
jgi:outer membrane murein-binding lipoprotein Lpp